MVEYYVEAIDAQGRPQSLTLSAKNSTMADELVRSQGLHPTLIAHAQTHQRQQDALRRRKQRQRVFGLAGLLLVLAALGVGGAVWRHIQELQKAQGFTLDAIRVAAEEANADERATGGDEELARFARDLFGAIHLKFPGLVSNINVKSDSLMFVHVTHEITARSPDMVRLITRTMTQALQSKFLGDQCTVLVILDGQTLADGRYLNGETTVNLHRAWTP